MDCGRGGKIDHLWIRVADVAAAKRFYETVAPVRASMAPHAASACSSSGAAARSRSSPGRRPRTCTSRSRRRTTRPSTRFTPPRLQPGYRDNGAPGERARVPPRLLRRVRARPRRQQHRGRQPQPLVRERVRFFEAGPEPSIPDGPIPDDQGAFLESTQAHLGPVYCGGRRRDGAGGPRRHRGLQRGRELVARRLRRHRRPRRSRTRRRSCAGRRCGSATAQVSSTPPSTRPPCASAARRAGRRWRRRRWHLGQLAA